MRVCARKADKNRWRGRGREEAGWFSAMSRRMSSPDEFMAPRELRLLLHTLVGSWDGRLVAPGRCEIEMSGSLWGILPEEVLERILLFAPAACILRFRAVCRRWRILLSSREFLRRSAAAYNSQSRPHLCYFHIQWRQTEEDSGSGTVSSSRTTELDLSFLPRDFFQAGLQYLTSHNGLLCLASGRPGQAFLHELAICVLNPITREYRTLPQVVLPPNLAPRGRKWVLRLIALPGRGFKVMFLLDRERYCLASTVGLYSSSTGEWSLASLTWADSLGHTCLFSDEVIYTGQESHMLLYTRAGVGDGFVWQEIPIPRFLMDRDLYVIRLVQHLTGLYAVILSKPIPVSMVGCCIWKMEAGRWRNVCILYRERNRTWAERERISVLVGNQEHVSVDWDAFLVVDDYIFVTLGIRNVHAISELSKRLLPRLLGFRISPESSRQVLLEVDQIVDSPFQASPIHLFRPRLDGL